jgi:phosphopantothenoylcysteine decarboxylase/phosphopantothenate--cysteine ligase
MKILVTAGPTHEAIDPVRFIGNNSSGKMGIAIAEEFAEKGHNVVLVKGPTHLTSNHPLVKEIKVESAQEMYEAAKQYFQQSDVVVFAAAVADYKPKHAANTKIKKKEESYTLELVKTVDIASELGKTKKQQQMCVGFALETDNEMSNATEKLGKKNLDFIVLNSMKDEGAGFGYDTNKITIIDKDENVTKFDLKPKRDVARDIVDYVFNLQAKKV